MAREWTIEWTETSTHRVTISDEEMQRITGLTAEELTDAHENDDLEGRLADDLANLDDEGFEGLERDVDSVDPDGEPDDEENDEQ